MSTPIKFDLISYLGASPLRFGMSPMQVTSLVGPPMLVRTTRSGRRDERREVLAVFYRPEADVVDEIEFFEDAKVFFGDLDVFEDQARSWKELLLADGEPFESLGTIVLLNLGITFSVPGADNKTITIFEKGKWNPFMSKLKRIPLPRG